MNDKNYRIERPVPEGTVGTEFGLNDTEKKPFLTEEDCNKYITKKEIEISNLESENKKLREEKDEQSIINIYFDVWLDSNGEEHTANVYHNKILKLAYGGDPENVIKAIKELLEQLKQQK